MPTRSMLLAALFLGCHSGAAAQERNETPPPTVRAGVASPGVASASTGAITSAPDRLTRSPGRRSYALPGAAIGFAVGAGATFAVLYSGGSTGLCNQAENQDAMGLRECLAAYALGGAVGAGVGALIGARFGRSRVAVAPLPDRRAGLTVAVAF